MASVAAIIDAATKPLTTSEAWYGIWFALALRKQILKTVKVAGEKFRDNMADDENSDKEE